MLAAGLTLPATASATQVYVSGSGTTGNAISPFSVGSNGSLTPISCGSNCVTGTAPIGVAMTPNGQYLYSSAFTPNKVSAFSVAANGSLTPVTCSGTNCNTGTGPYGIAVTPNGQFLYTANNTGNTVSPFSIGSGGALTPITCSGTNCNTGTKPYGVAVTPNGHYLYTANNTSNTVSAFSIGSNGSLTPITCSGGNCNTGTNPEGIAVSPNGQYLYTANRGSTTGAISVFSIGANGSLTPVTCGSGCNWGVAGAFSLAISSNGAYLYSTIRNATAKVATFSINSNGTLSAVTCSGTNCNVGGTPGGVAVSPNNQFAYASSFTANNVSPYSIGGTGALTPITCTSPNCNTAAGPDFQSVVVSPDQAPTAAFSATAARPGQVSSFNGSASTASTGQTVARYDWNFGDGQSAPNAGATPAHTYSAEGNYTVTLTVTDNAGCSTTQTFTGQTVSCNGSSAATTTHTVSVDGTPPNTIIDSAAHGTTADSAPSFDFHSTEAGSSFECSIDTGTANFGPCSGPGASHTTSALSDGIHTFRVQATDAQGNTDPSPATETFTVDTVVPDPRCPEVHVSLANYTPTDVGTAQTVAGNLGPTAPGIRARISIAEPSTLQIAATLGWRRRGRWTTVDLGASNVANAGTRVLRLALPASLVDNLPRGTRVTLKLTVAALPDASPGCMDPAVQHLALRTKVIRVLAPMARMRILPTGRPRLRAHLGGRPTETRRGRP